METKAFRLILIILFLVSSAGLVRAQIAQQKSDGKASPEKTKSSSKRQKSAKEAPEKLWLERAELLTEEAREEEWRLREERPLLLARLAEAWWKVDIKKARPWMDSAVGELERQPQNEKLEDTQGRTRLAESVLKIVTPLDRSYVERLLKVVAEGIQRAAENASTTDEKREVSRLAMQLPELTRVSARNQDLGSADRLYCHNQIAGFATRAHRIPPQPAACRAKAL